MKKYIGLAFLLSISASSMTCAKSSTQDKCLAAVKSAVAAGGVYYSLEHCLDGCEKTWNALKLLALKLDAVKRVIRPATLAGGMALTAYIVGAYALKQAQIVTD